MPQLSDILEKRKEKKFVKKSYRPWDLSGNSESLDLENNNKPSLTENNNPDISKIELAVKARIDNNTGNELDNSEGTDREQIDNDKITNREQIDNQFTNNKVTNREQIDNELGALSLKNRYLKLSGIQRKILDFIAEICLSREASETGPIETEIVARFVNASYGATKTSLVRLINKGFLERLPGRTAKGGFINIRLPEGINQVIIELSRKPIPIKNTLEIIDIFRSKLDNEKDNNQHYISISNNINTTNKKIPDEWEKINLEPLKHIGFSKTQLLQLYEKQFNTPQVIQEAINHFAYALENNKKVKEYSHPLNVLMGVLRKGQCWLEPNYESPQEIALRQLVEERKRKQEKQDTIVNELVDLEFPDWECSLTYDDQVAILPPEMLNTRMTAGKRSMLKTYFKQKILIPRLKGEGII